VCIYRLGIIRHDGLPGNTTGQSLIRGAAPRGNEDLLVAVTASERILLARNASMEMPSVPMNGICIGVFGTENGRLPQKAAEDDEASGAK
jgi:hypothetical protein